MKYKMKYPITAPMDAAVKHETIRIGVFIFLFLNYKFNVRPKIQKKKLLNISMKSVPVEDR